MTLSIQEIPRVVTETNNLLLKKETKYDIDLVLVLVILTLITNPERKGALDRVVKKIEDATRTTEQLRGLQDTMITLANALGKMELASQKEPTAKSWKEDKVDKILKEFAEGYLDFQKNISNLEKRAKKYPELEPLLATTEDFFKRFHTPLNSTEKRTFAEAILDWKQGGQDLGFHGSDIRFHPTQGKDPTQFNRMVAWMITESFISHQGEKETEDPIDNWNTDDKACMQMLAGQSQQSAIEMKAYMTLISSYDNAAKEIMKAVQKETAKMTHGQISQ
jgi:hypothetical protein